MVDHRSFLLEPLARVDNNNFPFQQHLKATCDFLLPQLVCVFFYLKNSSDNKWFNFNISFWSIYTIIPFLTCYLMTYLRPIVLEFTVSLVFLTFRLSSLIFFATFWMWFRLPHLSIVSILWCMCTHPINLMGIHLLHCYHGNECTCIHDAICDTFATITWNVNFHVGQK
jgi:hypothetical protein